MLIGLNGQKILIEDPAGPEKYTINLYKSLAKIDSRNRYIVYFEKKPEDSFFKELTGGSPFFSYKILKKRLSWTQISLANELLHNPVDVFFSPVHTMPIIRGTKTKFVAMIHGLEYKFLPNNGRQFQNLLKGKPEWFSCVFANKIIVPTNSVKEEIIKLGWAKGNKIEVVYEGVSNIFYKRPLDEIAFIRNEYHLGNRKYFIFISTIQPRKNIPGMVKAFSTFIQNNQEFKNMILLIVGKKGWEYEESVDAPKKYGVENNVIFTGRVPDRDLPVLLSGAEALINLSLKEGFGLPLLEAMACQIPCLVSDIEPFKEVGGDTLNFVNPNDTDDIAIKMKEIISNNNIELINKAFVRSKEFNWDKSAEKTLNILSSL